MKESFILVNTFDCIKQPTVLETIKIEEWLEQIKNSDYKELILKARKFGKGHPEYDRIKSKVPCITPNFRYNSIKKDSAIESATGLLYIDIDDVDFDINQLNKSKIFTYYQSFGGNGYGILVKVNDLTNDNFKDTYLFILNELGISKYYDKHACKSSQFNVLSYDETIFYNPNSIVFNSIKNTPTPIGNNKKEKIYTTRLGVFSNSIRFDDLNKIEIPQEADYLVNWDGIEYVKCELPIRKIKEGKRNSFLLAYCNNFVCLNPHLHPKSVLSIMLNVNEKVCSPICDYKQVKSVVDSVFRYKEEGTLKAKVYPKKRKIVFNQNTKMNGKEKSLTALKLSNDKRSFDCQKKFYDALENWNFEEHGKITQQKVITVTKLNEKTVEKYWKSFKDYIKTLNDEFKVNKASLEKDNIEINSSPMVDENSSVNVFKMDDEVDIKVFLAELYHKNNEQIDFDSIIEFCYVLNKSRATILEITETLLMMYKENRYKHSPYQKINIPRFLIELVNETKLVA